MKLSDTTSVFRHIMENLENMANCKNIFHAGKTHGKWKKGKNSWKTHGNFKTGKPHFQAHVYHIVEITLWLAGTNILY